MVSNCNAKQNYVSHQPWHYNAGATNAVWIAGFLAMQARLLCRPICPAKYLLSWDPEWSIWILDYACRYLSPDQLMTENERTRDKLRQVSSSSLLQNSCHSKPVRILPSDISFTRVFRNNLLSLCSKIYHLRLVFMSIQQLLKDYKKYKYFCMFALQLMLHRWPWKPLLPPFWEDACNQRHTTCIEKI